MLFGSNWNANPKVNWTFFMCTKFETTNSLSSNIHLSEDLKIVFDE